MSTPSTDTTSSETTDLGSELDTDTRVIPETHVIAEIPTDEVKELIQKAKKVHSSRFPSMFYPICDCLIIHTRCFTLDT